MWVKKHNSVKYHIIHESAVGSVYKSRKSIETTTRTYSQRFTYDTVSKGMDFSTNWHITYVYKRLLMRRFPGRFQLYESQEWAYNSRGAFRVARNVSLSYKITHHSLEINLSSFAPNLYHVIYNLLCYRSSSYSLSNTHSIAYRPLSNGLSDSYMLIYEGHNQKIEEAEFKRSRKSEFYCNCQCTKVVRGVYKIQARWSHPNPGGRECA